MLQSLISLINRTGWISYRKERIIDMYAEGDISKSEMNGHRRTADFAAGKRCRAPDGVSTS